MAKFVLTNVTTTINGTDFSDHISAVTFDLTMDEVETTNFGGGGYRSRIAGLRDSSVQIDFQQDFGASSIDATLYPLLGTGATVVVKPAGTGISATNPSYTGVFLVSQYQPVAGSIGDLATLSVTWPLASGTVTRGTV